MTRFEHMLQVALDGLDATVHSPTALIALSAALIGGGLLVAGSFVKTMIPLRWLAVGSTIGFLIYGLLLPSLLMVVLQAVLLPINIWRAIEMVQLTRRVRAASQARDTSGVWLRPYMRRRKVAAGEILFRKGDEADHLYMLASGRMELAEIGAVLEPGRVFGEIAFFAPDGRRTMTARALEPCELLSIDGATVRQLYYQNPDFGFELIGMVAGRLLSDVHRLEAAVQASKELARETVASRQEATGQTTPLD
jgi:CRP-like cAMP-binding protein